MYLADLLKGRQLIDCDATSWRTDRGKAAAEGFSKSKDCSFGGRPAIFAEGRPVSWLGPSQYERRSLFSLSSDLASTFA